jgi:hypothetical protein
LPPAGTQKPFGCDGVGAERVPVFVRDVLEMAAMETADVNMKIPASAMALSMGVLLSVGHCP